jgi:hypothetical protein
LNATPGLVAGASGVLGSGACVAAQPVAGAVADAVPEVVAKSPPSAPAPMARAPSAATTAVRRIFDGVTRPEPLRELRAFTPCDTSHLLIRQDPRQLQSREREPSGQRLFFLY